MVGKRLDPGKGSSTIECFASFYGPSSDRLSNVHSHMYDLTVYCAWLLLRTSWGKRRRNSDSGSNIPNILDGS